MGKILLGRCSKIFTVILIASFFLYMAPVFSDPKNHSHKSGHNDKHGHGHGKHDHGNKYGHDKQTELDDKWNKDTWSDEDEKEWKENFHGNEHGGKDHHGKNRSIDLVQVQHMDFGMLPSGGKRCVLKSNQNLVGDCIGNGVLGEIEVKGMPFYAYEVVVRELGWKRGRRLVPKLKAQDYYLDRHGKDIIYVRGTMSFMPQKIQKPGTTVLTYIVSVFYQ